MTPSHEESLAEVQSFADEVARVYQFPPVGSVRCWGSNETGQLAREPALGFSHRPLTVDALR